MTNAKRMDAVVRVERAERYDLRTLGMVDAPTATARMTTVVNLSQTGCLISGITGLSVGDSVTVSLRSLGQQRARVSRVTPDGFACAFDRHLLQSEIQRVVASSEVDYGATSSDAIRSLRNQAMARPEEAGLVRRIARRLKRN